MVSFHIDKTNNQFFSEKSVHFYFNFKKKFHHLHTQKYIYIYFILFFIFIYFFQILDVASFESSQEEFNIKLQQVYRTYPKCKKLVRKL
jgi:hypothetical protein